jgi:hypothetical protein
MMKVAVFEEDKEPAPKSQSLPSFYDVDSSPSCVLVAASYCPRSHHHHHRQ